MLSTCRVRPTIPTRRPGFLRHLRPSGLPCGAQQPPPGDSPAAPPARDPHTPTRRQTRPAWPLMTLFGSNSAIRVESDDVGRDQWEFTAAEVTTFTPPRAEPRVGRLISAARNDAVGCWVDAEDRASGTPGTTVRIRCSSPGRRCLGRRSCRPPPGRTRGRPLLGCRGHTARHVADPRVSPPQRNPCSSRRTPRAATEDRGPNQSRDDDPQPALDAQTPNDLDPRSPAWHRTDPGSIGTDP